MSAEKAGGSPHAGEPLDDLRPAEAQSIVEPDSHLVSFLDRASFEAEQYRILRHLVEERRRQTGLRILAVTSPGPGEGKTLTTLNLAGALAQAPGARVLLIDADLRRPSVIPSLGLDCAADQGLAEAMTDPSVGIDDVALYSTRFNLWVMPPGNSNVPVYEVLQLPSLADVLEDARERFDFVLVDTPPAVGFPDYRLLEKWVDGALLVICAGRTPRRMMETALGIIDPAKALGIVFNGASGSMNRYYGRYYGSYYRAAASRT
jgi:capsular exopolysaccharide synthesis family protein